MKLKVVESSMIHAVGYNSKTRELEVVFNSGRTYVYEGVPPKNPQGIDGGRVERAIYARRDY